MKYDPAKTQELLALAEHVQKGLHHHFNPQDTVMVQTLAAVSNQLRAAQGEIEALRKDAERYEYRLDCEVTAARAYLKDLNADDFKAKRRANDDKAIAEAEAGRGGE